MEEYENNGIFGVDRKQVRAVDGKQEIYLEWPYIIALIYSYSYAGLECHKPIAAYS